MIIKNIIYDLALLNGGNFANIDNFSEIVAGKLIETKMDNYEMLIEKINDIIVNHKIKVLDEKSALNALLINDLKKFNLHINYLSNESTIFDCLYKHLNDIIKEFKNIGLNINENDIQMYICDKFPKPFEKNRGKAICPDSYDSKKYGIPEGIYFLRDNLSYFQSRLLIAHEVLHKICSKKGAELLSRGLEEGICELIGSLYINMRIFPVDLCENYISFRRLKYNNQKQKFKLYTDYMRMAYHLYMKIGINGLVELLNKGRKEIKKVETLILQNKFDEIKIKDVPIYDKTFEDIASLLLLSTPENEVLSPLTYYILNKYNGEKNILDFSNKTGISLKKCKNAFEEIQQNIYGCILDKEDIEFSDIAQIKNNGNLKYNILGGNYEN